RHAQRETELSLVGGRGSDFRISAQGTDTAIGVPRRARDRSPWVIEMRGIGEVERLRPELHPDAVGESERAKQTGIDIHQPGAAQNIATGIAESYRRYWSERIGIEVAVAATDSSENLHFRQNLIGRLIVARRIQRGVGRRHAERGAAVSREDPVELPSAENVRLPSRLRHLLAFAERQLVDAGGLKVVRPVISGPGAIAVESAGPIEIERRIAVVVIGDRLREGVSGRELESAREAAFRVHLQRVVIRGT